MLFRCLGCCTKNWWGLLQNTRLISQGADPRSALTLRDVF
jgi:hypothetical protein